MIDLTGHIAGVEETTSPVEARGQHPRKMEDGCSTYSMDDALRAIGFGKFQGLMLAYSGMGYISEAMEIMLLSFIGPSIQLEWNLSSREESLITSVVFVGMLLGGFTWGIVSDNYGRRKGFLFTALITSGAGFLSAFAPCYLSLIFLRFIVGIGLGGGGVLTSWFLEFLPAPSRGTWMVVYSFFWTIGTIIEASLAWAIVPSLGWRFLLALSPLPALLLFLFYGAAPESPRYLCMKGRTTEAMDVLEKMARVNHTSLPSDRKCMPIKLRKVHSENVNLYKDVFITTFAEIPGLLLSAVIVDKIGRKLSISALLFTSCVFLFPLMFHQTSVLTTSLLFGARMCIIGSFTILYIYAPEVYPTTVRSTGFGVANSVGRIGGILCPLVAVGLKPVCHRAATIAIFEITIFLAGLAALFFPFETSGRQLLDSIHSIH